MDPLVNFRPKDSSDYIARVEGRELIKRRSHEALRLRGQSKRRLDS